ncbi:MAG: LptA/OstA family protein [Candidatus Zixiibacteriota bacterium]
MVVDIKRLLIFLLVGAGAATAAPPETTPAEDAAKPAKAEDEAYHVEADVTEGYYTADDQVLHGVGNVVIIHGDTTITCDEAYSYEKKNLATLIGNVKVRDKVQEYTLTSGYAEYKRDKKLSVATKSPKLVLEKDNPITITSDIMRMWTADEYGEAAGNVKIVSEDVEGFGRKLKYFGKEDRVRLSGDPVVLQEDSRLAGDVITMFLEKEKLRRTVVEGSARLLYFSRASEEEKGAEADAGALEEIPPEVTPEAAEEVPAGADAGTAEETAAGAPGEIPGERPDLGDVELDMTPSKAPVASGEEEAEEEQPTGRVEASGDRMVGFFKDGVMDHVDITGDAEGHYWPFDEFGRETGEKVDAAGDLIRVSMAGGDVKKILVEGNAEGVYRPAKAEGRSGVTQTQGDRISVFVSDREVRRIVVFGHARGSHFAEETPAAQEREVPGG